MKNLIAKLDSFLIENNYKEQFDAQLTKHFKMGTERTREEILQGCSAVASMLGMNPSDFFGGTQFVDGCGEDKAKAVVLQIEWLAVANEYIRERVANKEPLIVI